MRKSEFGGRLRGGPRDPVSRDSWTQTSFFPLGHIPSLGYTESKEEAEGRGEGIVFRFPWLGEQLALPLIPCAPPPISFSPLQSG